MIVKILFNIFSTGFSQMTKYLIKAKPVDSSSDASGGGTIVVSALLVLIVGLIVYKMIKDKKSGKSSCSCGGSCSGCGMSGSCHKSSKSESTSSESLDKSVMVDRGMTDSGIGSIQIEDQNIVKKVTIMIDGMMCGMCESHINDAIRSNLKVKKLKTSHATGISEFLTNDVVSDDTLRDIISKTGYKVLDIKKEYIRMTI